MLADHGVYYKCRQDRERFNLARMQSMPCISNPTLIQILSAPFLRGWLQDLAARNVLVGDQTTIKVADFGLTQKIPEGAEYWR